MLEVFGLAVGGAFRSTTHCGGGGTAMSVGVPKSGRCDVFGDGLYKGQAQFGRSSAEVPPGFPRIATP